MRAVALFGAIVAVRAEELLEDESDLMMRQLSSNTTSTTTTSTTTKGQEKDDEVDPKAKPSAECVTHLTKAATDCSANWTPGTGADCAVKNVACCKVIQAVAAWDCGKHDFYAGWAANTTAIADGLGKKTENSYPAASFAGKVDACKKAHSGPFDEVMQPIPGKKDQAPADFKYLVNCDATAATVSLPEITAKMGGDMSFPDDSTEDQRCGERDANGNIKKGKASVATEAIRLAAAKTVTGGAIVRLGKCTAPEKGSRRLAAQRRLALKTFDLSTEVKFIVTDATAADAIKAEVQTPAFANSVASETVSEMQTLVTAKKAAGDPLATALDAEGASYFTDMTTNFKVNVTSVAKADVATGGADPDAGSGDAGAGGAASTSSAAGVTVVGAFATMLTAILF